jgi:tripartite-type tricarboxylate transporter receptor subunit TctC
VQANRRQFLGALGTAALAGCGGARSDGPYPSRDITFVIPVGAGGGADIYARLVGAAIERHTPTSVNVVPTNVPSGGGGKGVVELFRAKADGYTIGILNIPGIFVLQRMRKAPYDFRRFTWLGSLTSGEHYGLAVGANSPIKSVADLQRLSQRREVTFATTGPEGMGYTATQISSRILGLRSRRVAGYRGSSDYVMAAVRGDTDAVVAAITTLQRLSEGNTVRILAAFDTETHGGGIQNALQLGHPELALLKGERVIAGPPGMPPEVVGKLAALLRQSWDYPQLRKWSASIGETFAPTSPEETAKMVRGRIDFLNQWLTDG